MAESKFYDEDSIKSVVQNHGGTAEDTNCEFEDSDEIFDDEFDEDEEEYCEDTEDYYDDDFFNAEDSDDFFYDEDEDDDFQYGCDDEPFGDFFSRSEDDDFNNFECDEDNINNSWIGFTPFDSFDVQCMKTFLTKWFKIFIVVGTSLTVIGVLLNNILKRE